MTRQQERLGFALWVAPSSLPGAGRGVFFRGQAPQDTAITLYPGMVYAGPSLAAIYVTPASPTMGSEGAETFSRQTPTWQRGNVYMYGGDGSFLVDGCPYGESAERFLTRAQSVEYPVDTDWVMKASKPQYDLDAGGQAEEIDHGGGDFVAAIGAVAHRFNHCPERRNVTLKLCSIPYDTPDELLRHFPNLSGPTPAFMANSRTKDRLTLVACLSQDLKSNNGTELFLDYGIRDLAQLGSAAVNNSEELY